MKLTPSLFWDTDPTALDPEKNKSYIIPRVMDYGTLDDVRSLYSYYGLDCIIKVLLEVPCLDKKTISYFAWKYHIPQDRFRAFRRQKEWSTWR